MKHCNGKAFTPDEIARWESDRITQAATKEIVQAKEDERLANRPKRSEINALDTASANANSVASLRAVVQIQTAMFKRVLELQRVEIIEDE